VQYTGQFKIHADQIKIPHGATAAQLRTPARFELLRRT